MKSSYILQFLLIIEIFIIFSLGYSNSIDYQDEWILNGLEIPFALFMITYGLYIHSENKITRILIFVLICRSVILMIPNIKYEWFMGVAIDQHSHFRLTQDLYSTGFIPSGRTYSGYPVMHLLFAIFSSVTQVSVLSTFKYLPILWWLLYPMLIYSIMKNLGLRENSLLKYALAISSIPVMPLISYAVTGILLGALLTIMVVSQFGRTLIRGSRKDWIILSIYVSVLALTHLSSSITLATVMLIIYLLKKKIGALKNLKAPSLSTLSLIILVNFALLSLNAVYLFKKLLHQYVIAVLSVEAAAVAQPIPSRFFGLDLVGKIRVILVSHAGDAILLLLSLMGILVTVKKENLYRSRLSFLVFYNLSVWSITLIQFAPGIGGIGFLRFVTLSLIVSPIFLSILIYYIRGKRANKPILFIVILSLIMVLATIELYPYQPLIPSARVISKDLPSDEPLTYVGSVNSAYQRYMLKHAERYIQTGLIACDRVTQNQIIGLTSYNFSYNRLARYYPFLRLLSDNITEKEYDYFLTHLPGKSGVFSEKAEIRTRGLILEALYNSNVLYTNGESHILAKPFMYFTHLLSSNSIQTP